MVGNLAMPSSKGTLGHVSVSPILAPIAHHSASRCRWHSAQLLGPICRLCSDLLEWYVNNNLPFQLGAGVRPVGSYVVNERNSIRSTINRCGPALPHLLFIGESYFVNVSFEG